MRERPILFSGPMVRAIRAERKTQTRRVIRPQPVNPRFNGRLDKMSTPCPYGAVGDRLWVRETWKSHSFYDHLPPRDIPQTKVFFAADDAYAPSGSRWRPSIFMPRWASRITLEISRVRVQRVRDISEMDAQQEGLERPIPTFRDAFNNQWNVLNAKRGFGWSANPWVWVIDFQRVNA